MADPYHELIDAAIQHLQDLKSRGTRFVTLSPEALETMRTPVTARRLTVASSVSPNAPAQARAFDTLSRTPHPSSVPPKPAVPPLPSQPAVAPTPQVASSEAADKATALASLRERALVCTRCPHLAATRKHVVFGVGNPDAELMFVGEAPGADEDIQGEPFVGRAGELLSKIIEAMGLSRDKVYIANILKCRPDMPSGAPGNRKPTPQEMQTCIPFLHEQIDIIKPKLLVGLGGTALEGLLGSNTFITKVRGKWQTYRGIQLMPTFHPSYVLRNQNAAIKRQVWEDMLQVMEMLNLPISEKQRGFFKPRPA